MKKLFKAANRYIETSDWKIIAVLKFCLISLGIMIGMCIGKKHKKKVYAVAGIVFIITYIPLMLKFYITYIPLMLKFYKVFKES